MKTSKKYSSKKAAKRRLKKASNSAALYEAYPSGSFVNKYINKKPKSGKIINSTKKGRPVRRAYKLDGTPVKPHSYYGKG